MEPVFLVGKPESAFQRRQILQISGISGLPFLLANTYPYPSPKKGNAYMHVSCVLEDKPALPYRVLHLHG